MGRVAIQFFRFANQIHHILPIDVRHLKIEKQSVKPLPLRLLKSLNAVFNHHASKSHGIQIPLRDDAYRPTVISDK